MTHIEHAVIRPEELLRAGYKEVRHPIPLSEFSYRGTYQKRFTDDHGVRYFIEFTHSRFIFAQLEADIESMTASAQFRRGDITFNVEMLNHDESLAQVESFFEELWVMMKLDHYDGYQESILFSEIDKSLARVTTAIAKEATAMDRLLAKIKNPQQQT